MKRINTTLSIISIIAVIFALSSCMPTKRMKDRPLLKGNEIVLKGDEKYKGDLYGFIQQEPNKRVLGVFWSKPWLYEKLDTKDPSKVNRWLNRSFATPTIYYDRSAAVVSAEQMKQYLQSRGFFNADVSYAVDDKDKATVTYTVKTGTPYRMRTIEYNFVDTTLKPFIFNDLASSLLKEGNSYDAYKLDNERTRITKMLRQNGYYNFSKEYIRYRVDSTLGNHQTKVIVDFLQKKAGQSNDGNIVFKPHRRYKIGEIRINPDQTILLSQQAEYDTLYLDYKKSRRAKDSVHLQFVHDKPIRVKPKTYARRIEFKNGQFYNTQKVQKTYDGLAGLNITQFASMDFTENFDAAIGDTLGYLDCNILINRRSVHSFSIETEGTNTAGRPGVAGRLVYQNKNIFRGGEVFDLSLSGALEAQSNTSSSEEDEFLFFNTIEGGVDANLKIPQFLIPIRPEVFSRDYHPFTTIHAGYNYQKREDYTRYLSNFSLGYKWKQSKTKDHMLYPIDINAIKIFKEEAFEERLLELDKKYQEQYTDHLISSLKYSFIFNNQDIQANEDFFYFRANVESAGFLMNLLNNQIGMGMDEEDYSTIFNIRYAQYLRTDFDLRYYHYLTPKATVVFHTLMGVGLPYGNSDALPFEKSFYAGGANGLRGWEIRSLGPGGYSDPDGEDYDRIGDILMEFSTEFRFPIYSYFNGALFVDAGNIWLLKDSEDYPKGVFKAENFLGQMAMDAGIGIRIDLQFFILRVDSAVPIRIPKRDPGNRWQTFGDITFKDFVWNFGIGYPF